MPASTPPVAHSRASLHLESRLAHQRFTMLHRPRQKFEIHGTSSNFWCLSCLSNIAPFVCCCCTSPGLPSHGRERNTWNKTGSIPFSAIGILGSSRWRLCNTARARKKKKKEASRRSFHTYTHTNTGEVTDSPEWNRYAIDCNGYTRTI
jgi:hypothetical protein